jgi:hypothetical protein
MVKIVRLAGSFQPPSISIEYIESGSKLKYRKFPVAFGNFSDPVALFETLTNDYPEYFNAASISPKKLKTFIDIIINQCPPIDLTTVTQEERDAFKRQMEQEFALHAVKPGDPDFKYDLQEDVVADEPCDWDD